MASGGERKRTVYVLELSRVEAELLYSYLDEALTQGAALDPQYEDMSWYEQEKILVEIQALLPAAV